jgi:acyl-CoA synthetase (AMP-forming)/AMP-acid ligase II
VTVHYRLWIGSPGRFQQEVDALMSLLTAPVLAGQASVVLSAQRQDAFDWIGDSHWAAHRGEFEGGGWIALQTSGTTGAAKWVRRRFENILAQQKGRGTPDDSWLLCYNPARWAGISVMAHVIRNSARLVVPRSLDPPDMVEAMASATHVSLTPSMFRRMLLHCAAELAVAPIRQVTFGGEHAAQRVLDDAKGTWPRARITHVYASTELGDVCAVSDGMEGVPRVKLRNFELADDGELKVAGHATGDLWECRHERLIFLGRREDIINVGGAKVAPSLVEAACLGIPEVMECRAYPVKNALLGEVVGLDYVGAMDPGQLRTTLLSALPKFSVPARINRMEAISMTAAGKTLRREEK